MTHSVFAALANAPIPEIEPDEELEPDSPEETQFIREILHEIEDRYPAVVLNMR